MCHCHGDGGCQVACMQFINIVVHSVEDMNFRVHLQYDFTKLNLDEHLEVTQSHDQISASDNEHVQKSQTATSTNNLSLLISS